MSESGHPSERRSSVRAPIELRVEYKRLNSFFADYTRNISKGGTYIRTDKPLPVGTELAFCLVVPRLDDPMRLVGRVVWIVAPEGATEERPAGMGIEFQFHDDRQRRDIDAWVARAMVEELGEEITAGLLGRKPEG
jgi:type IV pilus assembly protein PilZ